MSARIVDASKLGHPARRFFIASATEPGIWWRVDFAPGEAQQLSCSCPHGHRLYAARLRRSAGGTAPNLGPCRHLSAVIERLRSEQSAVA